MEGQIEYYALSKTELKNKNKMDRERGMCPATEGRAEHQRW